MRGPLGLAIALAMMGGPWTAPQPYLYQPRIPSWLETWWAERRRSK